MERMKATSLIVPAGALALAPRWLLLALEANGAAAPPNLRSALLAASAVGVVAALTLGNSLLGQAVLRARRSGLTVCWLVAITLQAALLAPSFVPALESTSLASALDSPALRWIWSFGAVAALVGVPALVTIAEQLAAEPFHHCPFCDWRGATQPALAGHLRGCRARQTRCGEQSSVAGRERGAATCSGSSNRRSTS
jgi:hypothetical protein